MIKHVCNKNDLHDLPLKFSRSAGTPLSLVSAISAAKFIILLSLTGLLNLADIVKKNQSYVHLIKYFVYKISVSD